MPELPEPPLGEDKSKTRRTEPSDPSAAPRGEQWKSRNGGRKRPAVCPREISRATAAVTAERRERADSRLRGRVGVTGPWYPSANPNAKPDQRKLTRARLGWPADGLGAEVEKQMRVVPDGRRKINDPCLVPREVIRYAGAAKSRGHRDVQGDALRGQGMYDRFRLERQPPPSLACKIE